MEQTQDRHNPTQAPISVGFVIDSLSPGAGTENQVAELLLGFDRTRVSATVFTLRAPSRPSLVAANVAVTDYGVGRIYSTRGIRAIFRISSEMRRQRLSLVLTFFVDGNQVGTVAGFLAGVPVVSSRRNIGRGYWHNRAQLRLLRWLNRLTRHWLANAEATRRYTAEAEGVPIDRITVIPNAIDTRRFRPPDESERRSARSRYAVSDADRVVVCVANLRPVKDHGTLLRASSRALRAEPSLRLLLAGTGDEEPALRSLAAELGIAGRVQFLGSVEDTVPLYHAADVAVLASVSESLPNAIVEALACGVPVAATDVGGVPELLANQPFGRLAPPSEPDALAEALLDLLATAAPDADARRAARDFAVSRFSLPVVLDQWYAFFERFRG